MYFLLLSLDVFLNTFAVIKKIPLYIQKEIVFYPPSTWKSKVKHTKTNRDLLMAMLEAPYVSILKPESGSYNDIQ